MCTKLVSLVVAASAVSIAQNSDPRPRFEVASIRECGGREPRASISASPGRLSIPCVPLFRLIQDAYQVYADGTSKFAIQPPSPIPIEGFPSQMSSFMYSIDAKAESPQSVGMMRGPMMQTLLEDRFHLKIRREVKDLPVYIMTVAKGGPNLQATKQDICDHADATDVVQPLLSKASGKPVCGVATPPIKNGSHFILDERGISVDTLAKLLNIGGLPVINRTGLTGTFDFRLEWEWERTPLDQLSPEGGAGSDAADRSIISRDRKST